MRNIETPELLSTTFVNQSLSDSIYEYDFRNTILNILWIVLAFIVAIMLQHYQYAGPIAITAIVGIAFVAGLINYQYRSVKFKKNLLDANNIVMQEDKNPKMAVWVAIFGSIFVVAALLAINSSLNMTQLYAWAVIYPIYTIVPKLSRYWFIKMLNGGELTPPIK